MRDRISRFVGVAGREDLFCAFVAGVLVTALHVLLAYPGLHPEHWAAAALACFTRPPESPATGLWLASVKVCSLVLGVDRGCVALRFLGHVSAGLLAFAAYYAFRFIFAKRLGTMPEALAPHVHALRFLTVTATVVFACSDFVWRLGEFFTADLLHVLLMALAVVCFGIFQASRHLAWAGFAYMLAGALAAETPAGVLLAVCFFLVKILRHFRPFATRRAEWLVTEREGGERRSGGRREIPVYGELSPGHFLFVTFFLSMLAIMLLDAYVFHALGGMAVRRLGTWDYPMAFASSWFAAIGGTLSWDDFFTAFALTLTPFVFSFLLLPLATDAKSPLAFPAGWLVIVLALGAETQLGPWAPLWYWSWTWREMKVMAGMTQTLQAFFCAGTVIAALTVVCCAVCVCRSAAESSTPPANRLHRGFGILGPFALAVLAMALLISSVVGRRLPSVRARLWILDEYVRLQAAHTAGLKWLFTDGAFDDAMRVAFRLRREGVQPVSVMSGHGAYDVYLRRRVAQDVEDVSMLEAGGAEALRFWVGEKPAHLAASAVQVGFRTLNKTREKRPRAAGTVMRVVCDAQDEARFSAFDLQTRRFSQTVLESMGRLNGGEGECDRLVDEKVDFMLWRLARMAEQRARLCSIAGDAQGVRIEKEIAEGLDSANRSLKVLSGCLERLQPTEGIVLTPREGLLIALRRADFTLARRYAEMVMRVDADDEQANFAVAMWLVEMRDYKRATRHFDRAIARNPKDPALLNNAALAYMKSGSYGKALDYAEAALKISPNSEVIKRVIADIRKQMPGS